VTATNGDSDIEKVVRFLSGLEPFASLEAEELRAVAASVRRRRVPAGEAVLVEGGPPGTHLFVVRHGTLELTRSDVLVAMVSGGEIFGHPTLLTGLPPEFTVQARSDALLYCVPQDVAVGLLSHPAGVRWLAANHRERLIQAARSMSALPEVRTLPVTAVVRSTPLFCEPDTSIREAARIMAEGGRSCILIHTPQGLGIVTDVDMRDKVVMGDISRDAPVATIMSTPVHTIGSETLAPEAGIAMMAARVNHLPVLDQDDNVIGIVSASNLMTLEGRSPFALRRSIQWAADEEELVGVAADVPTLFLDLLDAHLDGPSLTRVLTVLTDSITARLLEFATDRLGEPPVPYAWLAFGSAARSEVTLASDQDNGLAYADTDDPAVDEYFRLMAEDVNRGLARCGFPADPHGVLARNRQWRTTLSGWREIFEYSLEGRDLDRMARASVCFDYRQVAGELSVDPALTEIMRTVPDHPGFLRGLERLGLTIRLPLGFMQRLEGWLDIKKNCLVPIQNLARYQAVARGIVLQGTLERLSAVCDLDSEAQDCEATLREAFVNVTRTQLEHHARAVRAGRTPDNILDTSTLRPLTRANLQETLRELAAARKRFPRPEERRPAGDRAT
jgi:CBS domain-containing protein